MIWSSRGDFITRICQEDEESGESKSSKFPRSTKSRIFKTYPVKTFEVQFSGFSHRSLGPFLYVLKVTWLTYKFATQGRNTIFFYQSKSKLDFVNLNTCTSVLNARKLGSAQAVFGESFFRFEARNPDCWPVDPLWSSDKNILNFKFYFLLAFCKRKSACMCNYFPSFGRTCE